MCRGSVHARHQEDAQTGVIYLIGQVTHYGGNHRHGVLYREGNGYVALPDQQPAERAIACAACIRETAPVVLESIPRKLQLAYGIGDSTPALFISGDEEPDCQDKLEFPSGQKADLCDFADLGITIALQPVEVLKRVPGETGGAKRVLENA